MSLPRQRTTIEIDAEVLRAAKREAVEQSTTLAKYIEDALRLRQAANTQPAARFELPTFPGGRLQPGVNINSNAELQTLLDEGLPVEKLR